MEQFPKSPKGLKPRYFDDPATDQLLALVFSLASELSITRDRLDALERLLAQGGQLEPGVVDSFRPDDEARQQRAKSREAYLARLMESVEATLDAAARTDLPASEDDIFRHLR